MEGGVRLEESQHVAGVPEVDHLVDRALERAQVLRGQLRDGETDGHRLERFPHLVGLDELVVRQRPDDGAPPRPDRDEPLGREPAERLANGAAADAEGLGERYLGDSVPGVSAPERISSRRRVVHPFARGRRAFSTGLAVSAVIC